MGKTAREVMTSDAECIGENETIVDAAKKMADLDVGALPICGEDDRLKGMVTDRDIAVKVLARGKDPSSDQGRRAGRGQAGDDRRRRLREGGAADDEGGEGSPAARDRRAQLVGIVRTKVT